MKTNIYLLLYNSSITDIEHSPNYTAFGQPQNQLVDKLDSDHESLLLYIYTGFVEIPPKFNTAACAV